LEWTIPPKEDKSGNSPSLTGAEKMALDPPVTGAIRAGSVHVAQEFIAHLKKTKRKILLDERDGDGRSILHVLFNF
jgi:hypothetical protein